MEQTIELLKAIAQEVRESDLDHAEKQLKIEQYESAIALLEELNEEVAEPPRPEAVEGQSQVARRVLEVILNNTLKISKCSGLSPVAYADARLNEGALYRVISLLPAATPSPEAVGPANFDDVFDLVWNSKRMPRNKAQLLWFCKELIIREMSSPDAAPTPSYEKMREALKVGRILVGRGLRNCAGDEIDMYEKGLKQIDAALCEASILTKK